MGNPVPADCVQQGKLKLFFGSAQIDEQIIYFIQNRLWPGIRTIDLVDNHDNLKPGRQSLFKDKPGLGQRTFRRIHQQNSSVRHGERPFHFSAEIGMTGGINNVDADALPHDRAVLGRDGNPPFPFKFHGVHEPLVDVLIVTKQAALTKHGIHQSGLAVVDMRYDCDVSQFVVSEFNRHPFVSPTGYDISHQ